APRAHASGGGGGGRGMQGPPTLRSRGGSGCGPGGARSRGSGPGGAWSRRKGREGREGGEGREGRRRRPAASHGGRRWRLQGREEKSSLIPCRRIIVIVFLQP